jgi:calcium-dependent protein kinase
MWNPVKTPLVQDWLSQNAEDGQTLVQFMELSSAHEMSRLQAQNVVRNVIYLLPVPTILPADMANIKLLLEGYMYPLKVEILPSIPAGELEGIHRKPCSFSDRQHVLTGHFLKFATLPRTTAPDLLVLVVITNEDMYTLENKEEQVELGQAYPDKRVAIVSLARLHPLFYIKPSVFLRPETKLRIAKAQNSEMLSRALKVITHFVLCTLLFKKCIFFDCNMNGAYAHEIDTRPLFLCPVDLHKLMVLTVPSHSSNKIDQLALERYELLKVRLQQVLDPIHYDGPWLDKRLRVLRKHNDPNSPMPKAGDDADSVCQVGFVGAGQAQMVDRSLWIVGQTGPADEFYAVGNPIGTAGSFGQAYTVTHRTTGEERVVKVITKSKFALSRHRADHFGELRTEIAILKETSHPNLIKFHEVFETKANLYIVTECCYGGDLFSRIVAQTHFTEQDASNIMRQAMEGVLYLHSRRIAHCDLKPENFLFKEKGQSVLKIIDFGMSKHVHQRGNLTKLRGTPYYIAPEVIEGRYSEHCDIWSFGVIVFVCLFGFPPFAGNSNRDIFTKVQQGFNPVTRRGFGPWFPDHIPCSEAAKDLIANCLTRDQSSRLTAAEVLDHPWFNGQASLTKSVDLVFKNLAGFMVANKFKILVLDAMVDVLNQSELKTLGKVFAEIDLNGDGQVSPTELVQAFKLQGFEEKGIQVIVDVMKTMDADGDGTLSYRELLLASVQRKLAAKEDRMWQAFCRFDKDKDGTITPEEIAEVLRVPLEQAKTMIKDVDLDGDGKIDYDEFVVMMLGNAGVEVHKSEELEDQMWQAFCKFDKNGDGSITEREIAEVLKVSPEDARRYITDVDRNGDGQIDYQEFARIMQLTDDANASDGAKFLRVESGFGGKSPRSGAAVASPRSVASAVASPRSVTSASSIASPRSSSSTEPRSPRAPGDPH